MLRSRPLFLCALSLLGGILLSAQITWYTILIAVVVAVFDFIYLFYPYISKAAFINFVIMISMLIMGFLSYAHSVKNASWYENVIDDGDYINVCGFVTDKQYDNDTITIKLGDVLIEKNKKQYVGNTVIVRFFNADFNIDDICMGNSITVVGEVSLFDIARNPGNFDLKEYYRQKNVDFSVKADNFEITEHTTNIYLEKLTKLRFIMRSVYLACMTENECGLLSTMVLGDKTYLTDETKELYREGGLSHILAISGLHVSITGLMLFGFLRKRGVIKLPAAVFSIVFIISFCLLTGMGIATLRALIIVNFALFFVFYNQWHRC